MLKLVLVISKDTNNPWGIYGVRESKLQTHVVHMFDDNERPSRSPSVDSRNGERGPTVDKCRRRRSQPMKFDRMLYFRRTMTDSEQISGTRFKS